VKSIARFIDDRTPGGIATGIAQLITSGELVPEDRLPTVRDLASDLGLADPRCGWTDHQPGSEWKFCPFRS